jgi:hypothetical protein
VAVLKASVQITHIPGDGYKLVAVGLTQAQLAELMKCLSVEMPKQ